MRSPRLVTVVLFALSFCVGCCSHDFSSMDVGGGRKLLVLNDINQAYPLYATSFQNALQVALQLKGQVANVTTSTTQSTQITQLYKDLDNANADLRDAVTIAYSKYVTAMSAAQDADERNRYSAAFDQVVGRATELAGDVRKINEQLSAAASGAANTSDKIDAAAATAEKVKEGAQAAKGQVRS